MSAPFRANSPHTTPKIWLEAQGVNSFDARHRLYERAGAAAKISGFKTEKYDGPKQYEAEHIGYVWLSADHPARVEALYDAMKEDGRI